MFFADRYVFYIWTKAFLDLFLRYILLASVDTDFMASYNQKKWIFLIKGLTTGSGHHCSSSRLHICLLVTAPPDRPPEPTNALIKPLSLWFGATNGFLQLILLAFCPTFPSSFGSFSQWVTVVVWAADQENMFQKKYWVELEEGKMSWMNVWTAWEKGTSEAVNGTHIHIWRRV